MRWWSAEKSGKTRTRADEKLCWAGAGDDAAYYSAGTGKKRFTFTASLPIPSPQRQVPCTCLNRAWS